MNESMNADIVYMLCPYLDLGSLFSLAAAYPIWSGVIRKYMMNKLEECELNVEALNCFELRHKQWELIPKSIWKEVPFGVLDIHDIEVIQVSILTFQG
ncbi:unnamed protein product [Heligmosomoides polygyrus]|uniref:Transmembrane protein n=1 Tax=Heligmosomoides polygyrus TaxID=6339 RepID=A0A183FA28_HELPZ|nr:unnamed protein product [Heligmosomoides polygyrus]